MQSKLIKSIQSHPSLQPTLQRCSYCKSCFESNYYALFQVYDKHTKSNVNYFFTFTTAFLFQYLLNVILTIWKPIYQWSVIEFVGIVYFMFKIGYLLAEKTYMYLEDVSTGPFTSQNDGDSYLNPIDLTLDTNEELEALDALNMLSEETTTYLDKQIKTE